MEASFENVFKKLWTQLSMISASTEGLKSFTHYSVFIKHLFKMLLNHTCTDEHNVFSISISLFNLTLLYFISGLYFLFTALCTCTASEFITFYVLTLSSLYCMLLYSARHLVTLVFKVYYCDLAHQMFLVKTNTNWFITWWPKLL